MNFIPKINMYKMSNIYLKYHIHIKIIPIKRKVFYQIHSLKFNEYYIFNITPDIPLTEPRWLIHQISHKYLVAILRMAFKEKIYSVFSQ